MARRRWVWFGGRSHLIRGYGSGLHTELQEHWDIWNHASSPPPGTFVGCLTACGLRVQVHVPNDAVLADAAMPKTGVACPDCEGARHGK